MAQELHPVPDERHCRPALIDWNGSLPRGRPDETAPKRILAPQCKATFQFDPISAKLIDEIGVERRETKARRKSEPAAPPI